MPGGGERANTPTWRAARALWLVWVAIGGFGQYSHVARGESPLARRAGQGRRLDIAVRTWIDHAPRWVPVDYPGKGPPVPTDSLGAVDPGPNRGCGDAPPTHWTGSFCDAPQVPEGHCRSNGPATVPGPYAPPAHLTTIPWERTEQQRKQRDGNSADIRPRSYSPGADSGRGVLCASPGSRSWPDRPTGGPESRTRVGAPGAGDGFRSVG